MDNTQDALSALLSNPEALSRAMDIAKTFMASSPPQNPPSQPTEPAGAPPPTEPVGAPPPTPKPSMPSQPQDDNTRLLLALKPFLSDKRSEKVGAVLALMRAMQLMGMADLFDWRGK